VSFNNATAQGRFSTVYNTSNYYANFKLLEERMDQELQSKDGTDNALPIQSRQLQISPDQHSTLMPS